MSACDELSLPTDAIRPDSALSVVFFSWGEPTTHFEFAARRTGHMCSLHENFVALAPTHDAP
jgi:pyruvate-formate lyase-activating enzyme